ncbi:MAG: nitroreductase family protein [Spirochaetaceae bacterium]|jgi:nitroreductase|nr:nitroreductase family protein [Spirochaetaceae bacterium]
MKTTLEDLKKRRSIRRYRADQISGEELDAVLEAGTYAPTGMGAQSPLIVAVQNKADRDAIEGLNDTVFGGHGCFYGAPTVVNVLADKTSSTPVDDGNMVIANLLNAAYAVGLGSCYIYRAKEVFESSGGRELLKKWGVDPDKYIGIGHVILGYAMEDPKPKPRKKGYIVKIL